MQQIAIVPGALPPKGGDACRLEQAGGQIFRRSGKVVAHGLQACAEALAVRPEMAQPANA